MSTDTPQKSFGETVKMFRLALKPTTGRIVNQSELAMKVGCSLATMGDIESSADWFPSKFVENGALFAALGITRQKFETEWRNGSIQYSAIIPKNRVTAFRATARKLKMTEDAAVDKAFEDFILAQSH